MSNNEVYYKPSCMESYNTDMPICPMYSKDQTLPWHCDPSCAWFDVDRLQCAVLTIAKAEAKRK